MKHRKGRAVALVAALGATNAACRPGNADDEAIRTAVWRYQLESYRTSLKGSTVCIGVVARLGDQEAVDPESAVIESLSALHSGAVLPASRCRAGESLFLGPVTRVGMSEALVEGGTAEGRYRYHVVDAKGGWRVQDGTMLVVY